jgi:hypothetical protein
MRIEEEKRANREDRLDPEEYNDGAPERGGS